MKRLTITVVVTALIAFSLGYISRGAINQTQNINENPEDLTARESSESATTTAQKIVVSGQDDADAPFTVISNDETAIPVVRSSSRDFYMRKRLGDGDFFLINTIGSERAEQIIQGLVDADVYIEQKRKAMSDRHVAARGGPIVDEDVDNIFLTAAEKLELQTEEELLYRRVLDEYYEAYESFRRPHVQRMAIRSFSASLPEPLEYTTSETMVQIMYEENSRFVSELRIEAAGPDARVASTPPEWEFERERYRKHIAAKRKFYDRVMGRTRSYLTASQSEKFKRFLDDDIRRFELLVELSDIDESH